MKIVLSIHWIDTGYTVMSTEDPKEVKKFLEQYDHEGSSINVEVTVEDSEEAYKLLDWIEEGKAK